MKRQSPQAEPLKVFNGILDITEKDIARQNYYRLLANQSARNLTAPKIRKKGWILTSILNF